MSIEVLDFEYWEAKHAYHLERIATSYEYETTKKYQKAFYDKHRNALLEYSRWMKDFGMDYLHLKLGNKCIWCGRNNQEVGLQIDHVYPKLRIGIHNGSNFAEKLRDYENGEELRLLCTNCHRMRHSI